MARRLIIASAVAFAVVVVIAMVAVVVAVRRDSSGDSSTSRSTSTSAAAETTAPAISATDTATEDPAGEHRRGGSVRVAVWGAPDPGAPTLGGAALRQLVLPQLFVAKPDGTWAPWLVAFGTDTTSADRRSASFKLRPGASWSDGQPITVDDLRRSADARFVRAVDGPTPDGTITVAFTQPLPGWRRLWSGVDALAAPREGVWGGPFVVASMAPGLETVLHPNPSWRGEGPFLDEVRLVLVPDATVARQLLERGQVDVVAPPPDVQRTPLLQEIDEVNVELASPTGGGWLTALLLNPQRLDADVRAAIAATVDRPRFVSVLLAGEATAAGDGPTLGAADALDGKTIDLVGQIEEPLTLLLHRAMQKRARAAGGRLELRAAEADRVEPWIRDGGYDAAFTMTYDGPSVCWRCRWESVDAGLAAAADAGDENAIRDLQAKLAAEHIVLPLWRPRAVIAWRADAVAGVRANPFALSAASDAWRWYVP